MPLLKNCCFYFSFETATMVLGWLGLFDNTALLLLSSIGIDKINKILNNFEERAIIQIKFGFFNSAVFAFIGILFQIFFIFAVYKKQKSLILPWLIRSAFPTFISVLFMTIAGLVSYLNLFQTGFVVLILELPILALHGYFWFSVLSYCKQLEEINSTRERLAANNEELNTNDII